MSSTGDVLCAGIIVADHLCTPIARLPAAGELVAADSMLLTLGGCAANTAVDLVKMGLRACVAGRVGDDIFGRIVSDMMRAQGVGVASIRVSPGHATSQTLIVNVRGEDRRFIHTFGANGDFSARDLASDDITGFRAIYLGGYLAMPGLQADEIATVFATARQHGLITMLDVVTPGPGDYLPRVQPLLPWVDVFHLNQHEAALICGESDPVVQADSFRRLGAQTVVLTMGGEGAVLVSARETLRAGVFPVGYVDGSGGGDAFDAGFLYGMLAGMNASECLRVASALGASCVRALGTTPGVFTRAECEDFLRRHELKIERL